MSVQLPADVAGVDRRATAAEPDVTHELNAWFARLLAVVSVPIIIDALRANSAAAIDRVLRAVPNPQLPLRTPALKEARRVLRLIAGGRGPDTIRLGLDITDPRFFDAVDAHGARLVREVDDSIRAAIRETIAHGYRTGVHPYQLAPTIRETVGLTARQARSVMLQAQAMLEDGAHPAIVERRAQVYADRLRRQRSRLIARTETLRALNESRLAGIQEAARHGLVDPELAVVVWVANPDACPECQALEGTEASIGTGFVEGPPAHPNCRCTIRLDLNES